MKDYGFIERGKGRPKSKKTRTGKIDDLIFETEVQRTERHWEEIEAKRKEPLETIGKRMIRLAKSTGDDSEANAIDAKRLMVAKNKERIIEHDIATGRATTEHTALGVVQSSKGKHIRKVWLNHGIMGADFNW